MRCLARLMRWAIVASGTRNAAAISAVVRPPTARRVRAICDGAVSAGWQHRKSRASSSSGSVVGSSAAAATSASAGRCTPSSSSRRRRAPAARISSVSRLEATVTSQPRGRSGTPSTGHCRAAASSASCTASSHAAKSPLRRTSAARTCGARSRSRSSTARSRLTSGPRPTGQSSSAVPPCIRGHTSMSTSGGRRHRRRDLDRPVEALAVDDVEAAQVLLGLDVGAVGDHPAVRRWCAPA